MRMKPSDNSITVSEVPPDYFVEAEMEAKGLKESPYKEQAGFKRPKSAFDNGRRKPYTGRLINTST